MTTQSKARISRLNNESHDDLVNIDEPKVEVYEQNGSSIDKTRMMRKNESVQYLVPSDEAFIENKSYDGSQQNHADTLQLNKLSQNFHIQHEVTKFMKKPDPYKRN